MAFFPQRTTSKMLAKWSALAVGLLVLVFAVIVIVGSSRQRTMADQLVEALLQSATRTRVSLVAFSSLEGLPPPVARYLAHVLKDGQRLIKTARMRQIGELRVDMENDNWSSFTATQVAVPGAPGFVWKAKVALPVLTHVFVVDSYVAGTGAGHVRLLSTFTIAAESGRPELNSGALHRYLAEAVWYPTALLPESGVQWTPVDNTTALATLTDRGTTISLQFRFNDDGEVTAIYTPGRYGRFDGEYRQAPWEGHFRNYELRDGMRVPTYGEVAWYISGIRQTVWKGRLVEAAYELAPLQTDR